MSTGTAIARRIVEDEPAFRKPVWNGAVERLEGEPDSMLDFCMWLQREDIFNMLVSLANRGELK